jgi:hypothetical protein
MLLFTHIYECKDLKFSPQLFLNLHTGAYERVLETGPTLGHGGSIERLWYKSLESNQGKMKAHTKEACTWPWSFIHCKQDPIYVLPEMKLRALPNFHIHVSVSAAK